MSRDVNLSKTLMKMFSFVEAEILQGTASVCLQGVIEMLVSNIELISQSMNKLHGMLMVFFFLWLLLMCFNMHQKNYLHTMYNSVGNLSWFCTGK